MTLDPDQLREFAHRYTEAWCSQDPERVAASGFRGLTIGADGLIAASLGHFDPAEYDRQLEHGVGP